MLPIISNHIVPLFKHIHVFGHRIMSRPPFESLYRIYPLSYTFHHIIEKSGPIRSYFQPFQRYIGHYLSIIYSLFIRNIIFPFAFTILLLLLYFFRTICFLFLFLLLLQFQMVQRIELFCCMVSIRMRHKFHQGFYFQSRIYSFKIGRNLNLEERLKL